MNQRTKVLRDALRCHIRNLRGEVEINGFVDRAEELQIARDLFAELNKEESERQKEEA